MRSLSFVILLLLIITVSLWLATRMIINADPGVPSNVAIMLLLIFMIVGSLFSLFSWGFIRRFKGEYRYDISLRHGFWGGLFFVLLPLLNWIRALNILVVSMVLLIMLSVESLILLQESREEAVGKAEENESADSMARHP